MRVLVAAKADLECRDKYGKTPLLWAAAGGHEAAASALLDGGAALRACDHSGCDALMCACLAGHMHLATLWLQVKGQIVRGWTVSKGALSYRLVWRGACRGRLQG